MSWCKEWKGTPQDCINHVRQKHNVGDSVKTVSQGKWFPPWTVTRGVHRRSVVQRAWSPVGSPLPGVR